MANQCLALLVLHPFYIWDEGMNSPLPIFEGVFIHLSSQANDRSHSSLPTFSQALVLLYNTVFGAFTSAESPLLEINLFL